MIASAPDDRIPVRFGTSADAGPLDALLVEGAAQPGTNAPPGAPPGGVVAHFIATGASPLGASPFGTSHFAGCACCIARPGAAAALGSLFQARARGQVAWFTAVVAVVADRAEFEAALLGDRLAAARFRLD